MDNITSVASKVDFIVTNHYLGSNYKMEKAMLFPVTYYDGEYHVGSPISYPDVYALMELDESKSAAKGCDYVAIVTTGWAAPIDEDSDVDTRPSLHRDRRRVRLSMIGKHDEVASIMRFEDDPDNPIYETSGEGPLVDAVSELLGA
jgi:hypothetical protein